MSERKSKLQDNLKHIIKGDNKERVASNEGVTENNATDFSKNETKNSRSLEIDPFDEAFEKGDEQQSAAVAEVSNAIDKAVQNSREEIREEAAEPFNHESKPKKIKPSRQRKRSHNALSGIAIGLSVTALLGSGYVALSQTGFENSLGEGLDSVDNAIGSLTTKTDEIIANSRVTKKEVISNTKNISQLENIGRDIKVTQSSVDILQGGVEELSAAGIRVEQLSEKNQKRLNELTEKYSNLNKPVAVPKKTAKRTPVIRNKIDSTLLEGASLASLDMWGTQPYAVLRDDSGKWIPLTRGDYYKGWRFDGGVSNKALFKKGSRARKLEIKE